MTSPVVMEVVPQADGSKNETMCFFLGARFSAEEPPAPTPARSEKVTISSSPAITVYTRYTTLREALKAEPPTVVLVVLTQGVWGIHEEPRARSKGRHNTAGHKVRRRSIYYFPFSHNNFFSLCSKTSSAGLQFETDLYFKVRNISDNLALFFY